MPIELYLFPPHASSPSSFLPVLISPFVHLLRKSLSSPRFSGSHAIRCHALMLAGAVAEPMEVEYQEEYIRNSRGVQLFTCRWLPTSSSPKALVFLCHGYGMECSGFMKGEITSFFPSRMGWKRGIPIETWDLLHAVCCPLSLDSMTVACSLFQLLQQANNCRCRHGRLGCGTKLAAAGFGVFGLDYEGHGRSMGARCYIKKFDNIVADCDWFFKSVCGSSENQVKCRFLYGESMGGAVALLLHRKDPAFWDGAVLVAPMCKISEKVKPHPVVVNLLTRVEEIIPKWKIVPTKDVIDSAFKDPIKREEIRNNKLIYQDKPRLKTALELLRTSMDLESSLTMVTLPFFVLHGEADRVTDPEISRALYERAGSGDKTIKLYPGMWHGLTAGEPDDNVEAVFADIIAWLDRRSVCGAHDRADRWPTKANGDAWDASPDSPVGGGRWSRRPARFLCGWKGRTRHHSAM
ncbi:Putative lysophospholipase [Musa troglodytarum]|uniref:Lysophospholipase n=1 Tax=Musa troglodytarum TaxID=320322 RepID=A0A9E7HQ97_9LILI|nr:Putative lysophospholipase [Musa troglodytarum]